MLSLLSLGSFRILLSCGTNHNHIRLERVGSGVQYYSFLSAAKLSTTECCQHMDGCVVTTWIGVRSPHGWVCGYHMDGCVVTTWMMTVTRVVTVTGVVTTWMGDRCRRGHHIDGDRYERSHHMDG